MSAINLMNSVFPDNFILTIEYDGSAYYGWGIQSDVPTVQGEFARIFNKLFTEYKWSAAGRTDRGVHARGQKVSVGTDLRIPEKKLISVLNDHLPDAVRIRRVDFPGSYIDIRRSATFRTYRFFMDDAAGFSPFKRLYRTYVDFNKVDWNLFESLSRYFLGEHDFTNYSSNNPAVSNHVRKITAFDLQVRRRTCVAEITANGFLYNMVRRIMGTLLSAASGAMSPLFLKELLDSKEEMRNKTIVADPYGLYLWEVGY